MISNKKYEMHPNQYAAFDQQMNVFAGYKNGYPIWSDNMDDFRYINNTSHYEALSRWFPEKQIELIKM